MVSYRIEYSSYEKAVFTITGPSNMYLDFCQKLYGKAPGKFPGFKISFEITGKVLPLDQYL